MAEAAAAKPAKQTKPMIQTILLGVVILLLLGDLSLRGIAYFKTPKAEAASAQGDAPANEKRPQAAETPEVKAAVALEPFLVNLADKDSVRFVKASFQLGFADEKASEEFPKNKAVLAAARDSIISMLSSLTAEDVLSIEGKTKLREEIKRRVNEVSHEFAVQNVYIVEFVVQM